MFVSLKKKLTFICTLLTGVVLVAMVVVALTVSQSQLQENSFSEFESAVNSVLYRLRTDNIISDSWLARLEASGSMVIAVYDNGSPLEFKGSWNTGEERSELLKLAEAEALERGVDINAAPPYYSQSSGTIFDIDLPGKAGYRVAAYSVPGMESWKGLIVMKDKSGERKVIMRQSAMFALLAFAGVLALWGCGWWFVGKALKPIEENRRRQIEFVSAASHELRSPLAVIRASASALRDEGKFASNINRECARMGRLIDDLGLLASADAGTWSVSKQETDIDTLLIELFDQFGVLAKEAGKALALELPDDPLPKLECDAQRLSQTLSILLDNAISHTPDGAHITLRAAYRHANLMIDVEDDGDGIPASERERVFDRFYRVDRSRTDKRHFGLGLSIARELTLLQGFSLRLGASPEGGCKFTIEAPLSRNNRS